MQVFWTGLQALLALSLGPFPTPSPSYTGNHCNKVGVHSVGLLVCISSHNTYVPRSHCMLILPAIPVMKQLTPSPQEGKQLTSPTTAKDHRLCLGSWGWRKWQFEYLSHTFCLPPSYKSSMLELVAGTEFSKPESVKYLQLRRSRKEFVYTHWACVTKKKISLRHTGNMINSKTTSPTMLCYQEIMNDCRAARSCSNYTRLSLFT